MKRFLTGLALGIRNVALAVIACQAASLMIWGRYNTSLNFVNVLIVLFAFALGFAPPRRTHVERGGDS